MRADSLHKYMELVNDNFDSDETPPILFRGQRKDWPLLPKIARLHLAHKNDEASQPRLKIPNDHSFEKIEKNMFEEFKRKVMPHINIRPDNDWEWLALAQHHDLPTRLLDWTENPIAALWFTVAKPPLKDKNDEDEDGVVWAFKPDEEDYIPPANDSSPFAVNATKVMMPRHITGRIISQSSRFTVHKYMKNGDRFIPLEGNKTYKNGKLAQIVIPASAFCDIRCDLDQCGINNSSMFFDITGLCRHIEWQHSYLEDEVE